MACSAATGAGTTRSAQRPRPATTAATWGTKSRPADYPQLFSCVSIRPANPSASSRAKERPNAANHPPPSPVEVNDKARVGGRVHWLVRGRHTAEATRSAQPTPSASTPATMELNHARSPHATFRRRDSAPDLSALGSASRRRTPGITRRPERLPEHDKQRVGGRVHAVVRPPA